MPTSSVKMCMSIWASPGPSRLCKSTPRTQSARVIPLDHAKFSRAAYSLSMKRADRMRFRARGRLEPSVVDLNRIGFLIVKTSCLCRVNERKRCIRPILQVLQCKSVDVCIRDRKSTRLNSSHQIISYAVFCLKKKKHKNAIEDIRTPHGYMVWLHNDRPARPG